MATPEEKKHWTARREKSINSELIDEEDFEETRRCMLTSHHSYVQTHAGYIIALIIGFSAIVSTFESFIKSTGGTIVFIILILSIIGASAFMTLRIFYWTIYANLTMAIPIDMAFEFFNNNNKTVYKAPNTVIIQTAVDKYIDNSRKDYFLWHSKEHKKDLTEATKEQLLSRHELFALWFSQTRVEEYSVVVFSCLVGIITFTILGIELGRNNLIVGFLALVAIICIAYVGIYFRKKLKKQWDKYKTR